jgi:hypothetical protein
MNIHIIATKEMTTNLLDILTGTQIGCFTTIYIPNEVKILLLVIFKYPSLYIYIYIYNI